MRVLDVPTSPRPTTPGAGPTDADEELELLLESDPGACRALTGARLAEAVQLGDEAAEMRLAYYQACAAHIEGQDAVALAAADRAARIADERGALVWQSRALACRGLVHHELGHVEDAVELLRRAVELRREAGDPAGTAEVLTSLGAVYGRMAHFAPEAAQTLTEARRLWLSAGDPDRASTALASLAAHLVHTSARIARDNPRGARAAARRALEVAQQAVDEADAAGLVRTAIDARLSVVGAHLVADDLAAAGAALAAATAMHTRFPAAPQRLHLHRLRSTWLLRSGLAAEALTEAAAGLSLSETLARPADRAELLATSAAALERSGDLAGSLARMRELHELTVELGEAVAARRAVLLSSRIELERAERRAEVERQRASRLEESNARLAHEANHDVLTGLANRRALDAELARRVAIGGLAVALVDVDHFKRINDEGSHQLGDQVLARLGSTVAGCLREADLAARYGGEELALVLAGADEANALAVCERLRTTVADLPWPAGLPGGRVTVSIGVAVHAPGASAADLLAQADAALYRAKSQGRNRVCGPR